MRDKTALDKLRQGTPSCPRMAFSLNTGSLPQRLVFQNSATTEKSIPCRLEYHHPSSPVREFQSVCLSTMGGTGATAGETGTGAFGVTRGAP